MNLLENINYNPSKVLSSAVLVGAAMTCQVEAGTCDINVLPLMQDTTYSKSFEYSTVQSTMQDSIVKNDVEMLKLIELSNIGNIISNKYGSYMKDTWIPADGKLNKTCLFISLKNQDELKSEYEDLELDLYLTLKEELDKSQFFNMVALI